MHSFTWKGLQSTLFFCDNLMHNELGSSVFHCVSLKGTKTQPHHYHTLKKLAVIPLYHSVFNQYSDFSNCITYTAGIYYNYICMTQSLNLINRIVIRICLNQNSSQCKYCFTSVF